MSPPDQPGGDVPVPGDGDRDEARRIPTFGLLCLAVSGVIGSGWLLGPAKADIETGHLAIVSWVIGGLLVLAVAAVMVELSTVAPKTGGLIFLPLQTSGRVLTIVLAAGLWIFYSVNPASEAAEAVRAIAQWSHRPSLITQGSDSLTPSGLGVAIGVLVIVTAANLVGSRWFLRINAVLAIFKIVVPLLIVAVLAYAWLAHPGQSGPINHGPINHGPVSQGPDLKRPAAHPGIVSVLATVTTSGVIYAYLGFQGPLDFAGDVKRRRTRRVSGVAARLRWAVFGTIVGSILLYASLQLVLMYYTRHISPLVSTVDSPYPVFIQAFAPGWAAGPLTWLLHLDMVVSPAATAMVFTFLLTREIAELSNARLTHAGLWRSQYSVIRFLGARGDVYWLILGIDCVLSVIMLVGSGANWNVLSSVNTVMALVVYAVPSVTLAALRRRTGDEMTRSRWYPVALEPVAFMAIAVIFFLAGWSTLWPGMLALLAGCLVLFALPAVSNGARWYEANPSVSASMFRNPRAYPSAGSAVILFGFFAVMTILSIPARSQEVGLALAVPVAAGAWFVFRWLVRLSVAYMEDNPPRRLPRPLTEPSAPGRTQAPDRT